MKQAAVTRQSDRLAQQEGRDNSSPTVPAKKMFSTGTVHSVPYSFGDMAMYPQGTIVQAKLKINTPGDPYEQEADQVADAVMRMDENDQPIRETKLLTAGAGLQRACAHCEAEKKKKEEEKTVHRKENGRDDMAGETAPSLVTDVLASGGQQMDGITRRFMEDRFGQDFSQVRIHTGSRAEESASAINARAYTAGNNIVFGLGEYQPGSAAGKRLLAHELTHVGQQQGVHQQLKGQLQRTSRSVDIPYQGGTCKASREWDVVEQTKPASANVTVDSTNVTLNIKWCKGQNEGDIKIGADLTGKAAEVGGKIIDAIKNGKLDDLGKELKDTEITPFVEVLITQGRAFEIKGNGELTVDVAGKVKGGKVSVVVDTGGVKVKGTVEKDGQTGETKVMGGIEVPLGDSNIKPVECPTTKIQFAKKIHCECPGRKTKHRFNDGLLHTEKATEFLYFEHETTNFTPERLVASEKSITGLLQKGFRVKSITGFTSPEGKMVPSQKAGGFMGNAALAEARAAAALEKIKSICNPYKMPGMVVNDCAPNVIKDVKPVGQGELYTAADRKGNELEGRKLADASIPQFEANKGLEQEHLDKLTEAEKKLLAGAKTNEQKAAYIYRILRRVEIQFEKTSLGKNLEIELEDKTCPPEVLAEAEKQLPEWGMEN